MRCSRCKADKPEEAFNPSDGVYCRACRKEIYQEHKEARRAYARARYRNDPDRRRLMRAQKRRHFAISRGSPKETAMLIFYDEVYERDKGICQICKEPCSFEEGGLDHIVSCTRGGEHTYDNVQLAHNACNKKREYGL